MFKSTKKRSKLRCRVRVATTIVKSHADTTTGSRLSGTGLLAAVAEQSPGRSGVHSPQQPTGKPKVVRPNSQEREARMTDVSPSTVYFVGIDVSKAKLDLARTDQKNVVSVNNDTAGIAKIM